MTLRKLHAKEDGIRICPVCGNPLRFVDGGAVAIIGGQLDMENYKPRYECDDCGVFYREVLTSGYYDVFPLDKKGNNVPKPSEPVTAPVVKPRPAPSSPVPLMPDSNGIRRCPKCHRPFRFIDGGAVRVVNGKVDMENTKPKFECDACGVYYREVLTSGYYLPYPQEEEDRLGASPSPLPPKPRNVVAVGDLKPMQLKADADGKCPCPRCGEMMDYVEGGAVKLVDGRPNMDDVWAHFVCPNCDSVYRRIVNTDYYQWSEK
jgi:uncharacterized protein with PIN domain